jgi:peptidoglycan/LPS O-acetylase OafA/YrhL
MAIATIELLLRVFTTWNMSTAADELRYLCPTHLRIDGLLFGVLLSYYRHFQIEKFLDIARSSATLALAAAMMVLLAIVPPNNPIMHTFGFTVVYFGFGFLLARVIDARPSKYISTIIVTPLAWIGYYSYSIYLWHGWIARLMPHQTVIGFGLCLAASIMLGVLMAKLIEYPALALRDRLFPSLASSAHSSSMPSECPA